jgi:predicted DNA binding CopG/RHH family protein
MSKATRQRKAPKEVKYLNNLTVRLSQREMEALTKKASTSGLTKGQVIRKGLQAVL